MARSVKFMTATFMLCYNNHIMAFKIYNTVLSNHQLGHCYIYKTIVNYDVHVIVKFYDSWCQCSCNYATTVHNNIVH